MNVKELYEELKELVDGGLGDLHVLLSQDDEVNGVHECWGASVLLYNGKDLLDETELKEYEDEAAEMWDYEEFKRIVLL